MTAISAVARHPETVGVVLAGGRARRMGRDKAFVPLAGEPMIAHVARRLAAQCSAVVINGNGDPARFAACGLPVVADAYPDFRGPLAGILAALDWMAEHHPSVQWLASVAVDTPLFPTDFVQRLHRARATRPEAEIVVAATAAGPQPVNALWRVSIREKLRQAVASDSVGRVGTWAERHGAAVARWDSAPFDPFHNVNTPQDLERAEAYRRMEGA